MAKFFLYSLLLCCSLTSMLSCYALPFPPNGMPPLGWTQSPDAAASWIVASDQASEGAFSLKSAPTPHKAAAAIQFTAEMANGNITFKRKISSEPFFDFFRFFVDDVEISAVAVSGSADWTFISTPVSKGMHTVKFAYVKDISGAAGADAAWIDEFRFPRPFKRSNDLSYDGKSDIVFNSTLGGAYTYLMNGTSVSASGFAQTPGSPWVVTHIADFDGDGAADLVLQHADGSVALQLMDGIKILRFEVILGPGNPWKLTHVGDFNGDGKADLLFQNPTSPQVFIALMDGVTSIGSSLVNAGGPVTHVADIDGDGISDLVSYSITSTSTRFTTYLAGTQGGSYITPGQLPNSYETTFGLGWAVAQVVDVNGDGRADYILKHTDGRVHVFICCDASNPNLPITERTILPAATGWTFAYSTDLNGDGKADIIFKNAFGGLYTYLMNSTTPTAGGWLLGSNTGWKIVQSGDFNGDGKQDLLLQYTDGTVYMYLMDGLAVIGGGFVLPGNSGWSVAGPIQ